MAGSRSCSVKNDRLHFLATCILIMYGLIPFLPRSMEEAELRPYMMTTSRGKGQVTQQQLCSPNMSHMTGQIPWSPLGYQTPFSSFCNQLAKDYGSGMFSCALTLTVLITASPPFTRASTLKSPNAFNLSPSMPFSRSPFCSSFAARIVISSGPMTTLAPCVVWSKAAFIDTAISAVDTDPKMVIIGDLGGFRGSEAASSSAAAELAALRDRLGAS